MRAEESTRQLEGGSRVGAVHTPVSSRRAGTDDLSFIPARTINSKNRLAIERSDAVQRINLSARSPPSIPIRLSLAWRQAAQRGESEEERSSNNFHGYRNVKQSRIVVNHVD
jgi:hypothetical protein